MTVSFLNGKTIYDYKLEIRHLSEPAGPQFCPGPALRFDLNKLKRKMALRRILRYSLIANNQQILFGTSQMLNTVLDMKVKESQRPREGWRIWEGHQELPLNELNLHRMQMKLRMFDIDSVQE
ncbi:Acetyl-Coenzyme A Synthetase, Cytoplasmic [Manis pentadactyla]|nr:Acetyl-Coenzyme A Synthetase, Cytoplasmic [Manis pentadactyla]